MSEPNYLGAVVPVPPTPAEDLNERYESALRSIEAWANAYPIESFPEPDFEKVRVALDAAGLSLDEVSASNMRHVIRHAGKLAREALGT